MMRLIVLLALPSVALAEHLTRACSCEANSNYVCTPEELNLGLSPGMFEGESIRYLSVLTDTRFPALVDSAFRMFNCTGLDVQIDDAPGLSALQGQVEADLGLGLTNGGPGIYDGYTIRGNWLPSLADAGLLQFLNREIEETSGLDWADMLPAVKTMATVQSNSSSQVGMMSIDADYWMVVQREDLRVQYGREIPTTMEELAAEAEFFNGKDLNGDGGPDFGICVNLLTFQPWVASFLYFVVSPYLQTKPDSGLFFTSDGLEPLIDNEGWRKAAQLTRRLVNAGVTAAGVHSRYGRGRCAFLATLPGFAKRYTTGAVVRTNSTGDVVWSAGEQPNRMLQTLGSRQVVDSSGQLQACDGQKTICPREVLSMKGEYINVAPFFVAGSWGMAMRASLSPSKREMTWAFLSHVSRGARSRVAQGGQFMDAFRASHFDDRLYLQRGWTQPQIDQWKSVHGAALGLGVEPNPAIDLMIPGYYAYLGDVLEGAFSRYLTSNITLDGLVNTTVTGWKTVSNNYGGTESQLRIYRRALGLQDIVICPAGQAYSASSATCITVQVTLSCTETGCGKYAVCPVAEGNEIPLCVCASDDTQPAADFVTSRACNPTVASTDQQRVFWTLSMLFFGLGGVLCVFVMHEFFYNKLFTLTQRGGSMWSFAAIAIPDFVLAIIYFAFHFTNLINGVEMGTDACHFFSVITTMVVFATFFGPPIVGLVTLLTFYNASHGSSKKIPKVGVGLVLFFPWLIGLAIGLAARADGKSGSYRGLLCYNSEWDSFATGGITLTIFLICTVITVVSYVITALMVRKTLAKPQNRRTAQKYFKDVLKRGAALVCLFFFTWAPFIVVVILNMSGTPVSLTAEMLASLVISLQPIMDTFVILNTPAVRAELCDRMHIKYGSPSRISQIQQSYNSTAISSISSSAGMEI